MSEHSDRTQLTCPLERDAALFDAMADEVHVDLQKAADGGSSEAIARARVRCKDCEAVKECERWLDSSMGIPFPPIFCPNAPFFHLCIAAAHDQKIKPP